jgi:hypothetical protein
MLRLWFGASAADAVDIYPLLIELEHGESYAVIPALDGQLHRVSFAQLRYPAAARITFSASQLGAASLSCLTLRAQALARMETGEHITAFVQSTCMALSLVLTAMRPALLADTELAGGSGSEAVSLEAIVVADGTFSDISLRESAEWRERE